jgi:SAM-dependent methyltransferase
MEQVREAGLVSRVLLAQVDLDRWRPPANSFDLVCVFRFLNRELVPALLAALRPGGILIYHTYHVGRLAFHPDATRSFLLLQGQLQEWTAGWDILHEEEDLEMAGIVARKTEASSER